MKFECECSDVNTVVSNDGRRGKGGPTMASMRRRDFLSASAAAIVLNTIMFFCCVLANNCQASVNNVSLSIMIKSKGINFFSVRVLLSSLIGTSAA